ncbi:MAG: ATP-binding protein [Candidatus Omnitrophota bacterium]|nr:ATP-binding protein [Candidatus Omnitrophota bacterium]
MEQNMPAAKNDTVLTEDMDYQKRLLLTSFEMRIFSVLLAFICASVIQNIFGMHIPGGVWIVFSLWLLTSVLYFAFFRTGVCKTRKCLDNVHFSYYFPGVLYATMLVHYLGGAEWIAFFIYFFDLVYANLLMRRSKGIFVTGYVIACYFSLVWLEYKGVIAHQRTFPPGSVSYDNFRYILTTHVVIVGFAFFIISYAAGLFSQMKEEREKTLRESKNRLLAKSDQLEEITRTLTKEVAENKYLKRVAMGYVEKKEFELETVKKDLEEQIEKLRKTQKAMVFMIKDLNDMSAQLKDTRDHLEEKVRDRTEELLTISRKLHRSERLAFLGKLAGSVTHELRNPLAVLKNAAYFLDKKFQAEKKDEKVVKYVYIMKKEITIIDSIIDDIMGFAKTRAPDIEEAEVKDVVENAVSAVNVPELVEIKKEFEDLPKVHIDSNQIMHAVMNLANNAIMAMKGNGTLTFRITRKNDHACIEVKDTGPGIPPDQRELIFEPLYSSKPKGTGLGLPIAKMMVENQEGRIEFESELGEGTVFRILLPINRKRWSGKNG